MRRARVGNVCGYETSIYSFWLVCAGAVLLSLDRIVVRTAEVLSKVVR